MDTFGKLTMNCEQVEAIVFDLDRDGAMDTAERAAAMAHLANCSRCAALQDSWQSAREELRTLGEETLTARTPKRVEMRLRQEFGAQQRGLMTRRRAIVAVWALAAAAVLVGAVSVRNWRQARQTKNGPEATIASRASSAGHAATGAEQSNDSADADDSAEFTPLPGTTLDDSEEATILRVRMQRGSLVALGLPVNEQRAGDWIQVDMLVGTDGLPQAVRLSQEEN